MKSYNFKIEINGVGFEVPNIEAQSEQDARDQMWHTIRKNMVINEITAEEIPEGRISKIKNRILSIL